MENENKYPCLVPRCTNLASHYALNNAAKYGHICDQHFRRYINFYELQAEEVLLYSK